MVEVGKKEDDRDEETWGATLYPEVSWPVEVIDRRSTALLYRGHLLFSSHVIASSHATKLMYTIGGSDINLISYYIFFALTCSRTGSSRLAGKYLNLSLHRFRASWQC